MTQSKWNLSLKSKKEVSTRHSVTRKSQVLSSRNCNMCGNEFTQSTRFDRFCQACRDNNEVLHYADWAIYS